MHSQFHTDKSKFKIFLMRKDYCFGILNSDEPTFFRPKIILIKLS